MSLTHLLVLSVLFLGGMMLGHFLWYISYGYRLTNKINWGHGFLNWLDGMNRLLCHSYHRLHYDRPLPLPASGPALVVCNHTSKLDPLLLVAASRRPLRFLVPHEEFKRFGLGWLLRVSKAIPVDTHESDPAVALRQAVQALRAGEVVALFPQGRVTLPAEVSNQLKNAGVWLSECTDSPMYPVFIHGVKGIGPIALLRALLQRSRAHLVAYPSFYCAGNGEACQVYLQALFEGWKPSSLLELLKQRQQQQLN